MLFGVGPAYLFVLQHRLPIGAMRKGWEPWVSTMATNLGIAVVAFAMIWALGVVPFLLVHLSTALVAASVGVWLFYVQHQFEHTYWAPDTEWAHPDASLHGSSHYALPAVLRWFTANIGIHHVHHLNSRIPFYRLPEVLRNHPELGQIGRLTFWQSLRDACACRCGTRTAGASYPSARCGRTVPPTRCRTPRGDRDHSSSATQIQMKIGAKTARWAEESGFSLVNPPVWLKLLGPSRKNSAWISKVRATDCGLVWK